MKKFYMFIALFLSAATYAQTNYTGNGKDGFGGTVGNGSLTVSDDGNVITLVFKRGSGDLNDALVFYVDSKAGGFNSTSGFLDQGDGLRKAISGVDGTNRSVLSFPTGFEPDYAIAMNKDYAGVWMLQGGSTEHTFVNSASLTPLNTGTAANYTLTVNKADLGMTGAISFKFLGTYTSESAYRSNEAIGDLMAGFTSGWNNQTILTFNGYGSILPVKITSFKAVKERNAVAIKWSVAQETNIDRYQVERSRDGVNFTTLQTLKATNLAAYNAAYNIVDKVPARGANYYRLAIIENGRKEYSSIVSVTMNQDGTPLVIYHTPGSTRLNVKLVGLDAGTYSLGVVNTAGQLIQNISINHDGADMNKVVDLKGGISKGVYRVVLTNESTRSTASFIVP